MVEGGRILKQLVTLHPQLGFPLFMKSRTLSQGMVLPGMVDLSSGNNLIKIIPSRHVKRLTQFK